MKKFSLTTLLIIITLGFSSCSQDDALALDEPTGALFQKMTFGRTTDGSFTLDYKLNDGVGSDIVDNQNGNGKDIYLYSSDNEVRKNVNEDISLNGNDRFSIGVNNTINDSRSTLTVFDNDIRFNKSESEDDHLAEYQMVNNGDGTYDLNFTVDNNIKTSFIQNEDTGVYEIHLEEGQSSESSFSLTFTKEVGNDLKISFINYFNQESGNKSSETTSKKPQVVIGGD
ncbi:MAG: hypothetical protein JXR05_09945 [Flavobacteriaceae bacterium]